MNTLDEVIIALEVCTSGYCSHPKHGDCPYLDERNDCDTRQRKLDALQWLKGYKAHIELDRLRDKCEAKNDPLTWEELKSMEGKPVWVEDNIDEPEDTTKYWAIYRRIEKTQETEYALLSDFYYDKAQYGESWQAYRKERIDGQQD